MRGDGKRTATYDMKCHEKCHGKKGFRTAATISDEEQTRDSGQYTNAKQDAAPFDFVKGGIR
jgi:hypothetical protein